MRASFVAPFACAGVSRKTAKAASKAQPISSLSVGDYVLGKVTNVGGANSAWIDIGVATLTGKPIRARLKLGKRAAPKVGAILPVTVHRLNVPAARVEVRRNVSTDEMPLTKRLEDVQIGERITGVIVGFAKVGAVVDVGVCRPGRRESRKRCLGLLRNSSFLSDWTNPLDPIRKENTRVLERGDELELFVRMPKLSAGQLFLSAIEVSRESVVAELKEKKNVRKRMKRRRPVSELEIGSKRHGVVRNIVYYGAFIDIGMKTNGLIHFTDMGPFFRIWRTVVQTDMRVDVRVKVVDGERVNLELLGVEGYKVEEEAVNPALVRPGSSVEKIYRVTKIDVATAENDTDDENDEDSDVEESEETESEDAGLDKFTDEYFENKYDF